MARHIEASRSQGFTGHDDMRSIASLLENMTASLRPEQASLYVRNDSALLMPSHSLHTDDLGRQQAMPGDAGNASAASAGERASTIGSH